MTKQVLIVNADSNNAVQVRVRTFSKNGDLLETYIMPLGGQFKAGWIHSGQYILIDEVPVET